MKRQNNKNSFTLMWNQWNIFNNAIIYTSKICFHLSCRYSIDRNTDLERYFNIDANTGVITTAKTLDRETNAVHNITVLAMESRKLPIF